MSSPTPPPDPDDAPLDLGARIEAWQRTLAALVVDVAENPDPLLPLVDELRRFRGLLTLDRWTSVAAPLLERLGWPVERLEAAVQLTNPREVRWALQAAPVARPLGPMGNIYPISGWLGEYLAWQAQDQVPQGFHFWTAMSVLSATLRRNVYVDKGRFVVWPDTYSLLVGVPATKKGQAMGIGLDLLLKLNDFMDARGVAKHEHFRILPEYGTIQFAIKEMQSVPVQQVRVGTAATFAPSDSHAVLFVEELVTLLSNSAFNPQAILDFLTGIYNSEKSPRRGTLRQDEEKLHRPSVTFLGGVTPYGLRTQLPRSMVEGGFVSRNMFIYREPAPEAVTNPPPADPIFRDVLAERLLPLIGWRNRVIRQTREAREWEDEWYSADYRRTVAIADDRSQAQYGRRQIHVLKVAMLLVVSEGRDLIELADIQRAVAIVDEEHNRSRSLLDDVGAHDDVRLANEVVRALDRHGGRLLRRVLYNLVKHRFGNTQNFDRIAASLKEDGRVSIYKQGQTDLWVLNGRE